jgi:2-keto-4-pentenoate hydratase/2-oxohepta-3-ene-1,7-dioic acid hydratase in catechol pathway
LRLAVAIYNGKKVFGEVRGGYLYIIGEGDLRRYIEYRGEPKGESVRIDEVELQPPMINYVICVVVNSAKMLGLDDPERAKKELSHPRFTIKTPNTLVGHMGVVRAPRSGIRPEVEIALITAKRIERGGRVKEGILGYTVFNDVTASALTKEDAYYAYRRDPTTGEVKREYVRGAPFIRKNWDTFGPIGPWIVTPDEFGEFRGKDMYSSFEGEMVQKGSSDELLFDDKEVLEYLSSFMTIEAGTIISMGSIGYLEADRDHSEYLLPSREGFMEAGVEGIGVLKNRVIFE